jgi:hypothetical protein
MVNVFWIIDGVVFDIQIDADGALLVYSVIEWAGNNRRFRGGKCGVLDNIGVVIIGDFLSQI